MARQATLLSLSLPRGSPLTSKIVWCSHKIYKCHELSYGSLQKVMLKQLKVMGSFQWAGQTEANWAWNTGQGYVVFCGVQATIFIVISAFWLAFTDHHDNLSCTACNITSIKVQKFWLLKTYSYTRFIVSMVHNNITSPTHAHPLVPFLQKILISVLRFPY